MTFFSQRIQISKLSPLPDAAFFVDDFGTCAGYPPDPCFTVEGGASFEEGTTPFMGLGLVVELIEVAI